MQPKTFTHLASVRGKCVCSQIYDKWWRSGHWNSWICVLFGGQYCSDDGDTIIRTQWKQGQRCGIWWNRIPTNQLSKGLILQPSKLEVGQQVLDYIELFYLVQARCGLDKWEEVAAYRQCHGLRLDIQHLLAFQNFYAVDRGTTCVKSKRDGQPSTCEFSSFKRISKSSVTHI